VLLIPLVWERTVQWTSRAEQIQYAVVERLERVDSTLTRTPLRTEIDGQSIPFPPSVEPERTPWPPTYRSPDPITTRLDRILSGLERRPSSTRFDARDRLTPSARLTLSPLPNLRWTIRYREADGPGTINRDGTATLNARGELELLELTGHDVPMPNGPFRAELRVTQRRLLPKAP